MVARVGEIRRHHWAHESGERCDEWWENESEWRNSWIQTFSESPIADIENVLEKDGRRHFYDARFKDALVVVCRRTKIDPELVRLREDFFGNMFWLVEASKSEYGRFRRAREDGAISAKRGSPQCYQDHSFLTLHAPFYLRWMECRMPVVFDFKDASEGVEDDLWCVLPGAARCARIVLQFKRDMFVSRLTQEGYLLSAKVEEVVKRIEARERKIVDAERAEERRIESSPSLDRSTRVPAVIEKCAGPRKEPPKKSFEELVEQYMKWGFSRGDAERKARLAQ